MKKNKLLLLLSTSVLCSVAVATFCTTQSLENLSVFAAIPRPPEGPYQLQINNFTKYDHDDSYFVAKTINGNDITFEANYGGFSPLSENYFTLLAGRDFYNDTERRGNNLYNEITDITGVQIIFNEGGSLELQASYCYVEISRLYEEPYKFAGDVETTPITSGITISFEQQNGHFPNRFELNAKADTTITAVNIAYRCGVPLE